MNITIRNDFETTKEFDLNAINLLLAANEVKEENEDKADADCKVYYIHVRIWRFEIDTLILIETQSLELSEKIISNIQKARNDIDSINRIYKVMRKVKNKAASRPYTNKNSEFHQMCADDHAVLRSKLNALKADFKNEYDAFIKPNRFCDFV